MTKKQKIWLDIFVAMFVVPELFFSFFLLSIINLFGKDFSPLYLLFIKQQFFIDHPVYLISALIIEWFGVLALLVFGVKNKNRKLYIVLLSLLLLWMSVILFMGYVFSFSMSFP